jgi:hypothetical protein
MQRAVRPTACMHGASHIPTSANESILTMRGVAHRCRCFMRGLQAGLRASRALQHCNECLVFATSTLQQTHAWLHRLPASRSKQVQVSPRRGTYKQCDGRDACSDMSTVKLLQIEHARHHIVQRLDMRTYMSHRLAPAPWQPALSLPCVTNVVSVEADPPLSACCSSGATRAATTASTAPRARRRSAPSSPSAPSRW